MENYMALHVAERIRKRLKVMGWSCGRSDATRAFLSDARIRNVPLPCLCGQHGSDVVVADYDRFGIPVRTVLCLHCGLLRSDPYYTEESLAAFYAQYYRKIYSGADTRAIEYIFESEWQRGESIYKLARSAGFSPQVVYDIGCGAGGTLAYLAGQGCTVYGCDFDDDYLDRARKAGVPAHKGGIDALASCPPADLIILHHVLEHLRDPMALLMGARKLLSSTGVIYVALPGIFNIGKQYPYLGYFFQNAHAWHFCLQTLDGIASRAGLQRVCGDEVIESLYVPSEDTPYVATNQELAADILTYLYNVGEDTKWKCRLAVMDRCLRYTFRRVGGGRVYKVYRFAKRMLVRR